MAGRSEERRLGPESSRVCTVAFSHDDRTLATGGESLLALWDAGTGRKLATVMQGSGTQLAAGDVDGTIRLWRLN